MEGTKLHCPLLEKSRSQKGLRSRSDDSPGHAQLEGIDVLARSARPGLTGDSSLTKLQGWIASFVSVGRSERGSVWANPAIFERPTYLNLPDLSAILVIPHVRV